MATRIEMDPDGEEMVLAGWREFAETRLGPDIAGDARRYCPERTGALRDSIENHMEADTLIVSATGGDQGRVYAAYHPWNLGIACSIHPPAAPGRRRFRLLLSFARPYSRYVASSREVPRCR